MWCSAYLQQARSDWAMFETIQRGQAPSCHRLHYLQMTTEKLGKAVLLRSGSQVHTVNRTHRAFVRCLRVASRNPSLGMRFHSPHRLRAFITTVLPVADDVERLAPAIARNRPNAEYPWRSPQGAVVAPASHTFTLIRTLTEPRGLKLLDLVKLMLDQFDVFF